MQIQSKQTSQHSTSDETKMGDNIDYKNEYEFWKTIATNRLSLIKSLLTSSNLDANARYKKKRHSLLHEAAADADLDLTEVLIKLGAKVDCRNNYNKTPLHLASEKGNDLIVSFLLDKGADKNALASNSLSKCTPLHLAAEKGHLNVVARLLESGAQTRGTNDGEEESTPLHLAVENGHSKVVALLLKYGARTDIEDIYGDSPIHLAVESGNVAVVTELLNGGDDIEKPNCEGKTALHVAAEKNQCAVLSFLLSKGANIHSLTEDGQTPLFLASSEGHWSAVALLLANGAKMASNGTTALHKAASSLCSELIEELLEAGADLKARDSAGCTPLHYVLDYDVAKMMIFLGASIDCKDLNGKTPLHYSSEKWRTETVSYLLESGADINSVSGESFTVFDYARENAAHYNRKRFAPFLRYLERFVMMMISINLYVCENLLKEVENKELDEICTEELARLKITRIGSSDITFYNFLGKTKHQLVMTLRSKSLQEYFKLDTYKADFPNFSVLISHQFHRGSRRKLLVDKVVSSCHLVFNGLLEECVLEILKYFSDEELMEFFYTFTTRASESNS